MLRLLPFLLALFAPAVLAQNSLVISQYVETNSGTTPKGIEVTNVSSSAINFATTPLTVWQGTNGGALALTVTVNTGSLAAGTAMVIGTSDMGTYLTGAGLGTVRFVEFTFVFNGDDAVQIRLSGTTEDTIGTPGSDPGSDWNGSGVSTANQNIQLRTDITAGAPAGFTNPSLRFTTVSTTPSTLPAGLAGFGVPPSQFTQATGAQTLGSTAGENNDAGWRMLAAPVDGLTVAYLVGQNLVQGIPGEFPTFQPNLFTSYNGLGTATGFAAPAGESTELEPGKGFFWYLYDRAFDADPANTAGSSQSYPLPRALSATGPATASTGSYSPSAFPARPSGTDAFYLMGNPFNGPFDLSGVTVSSGTLQNSVYVYDAAIANYQVVTALSSDGSTNNVSDDLAVWQGFFAQVTGVTTTATLTPSYNTTFVRSASEPPFYGRGAGETMAGAGRDLRFRLDGTLASGANTVDVAAAVQFVEGAMAAWDAYDLQKMGPMGADYALLAVRGALPDGSVGEKGVESRELDPVARFTVPVAVSASEAGTFTLTWSGLSTLPAQWSVTLRDLVTGQTVDLRSAASHVFTAQGGAYTDRFALEVNSVVTATEPSAVALTLTAAVPNPTAGRSTLTLTTATSERVTAEVFDALGRRVATVYEGQVAAGVSTALAVDASSLAPGAYVMRVTGETFAETRRLTVVR